MPTNRIEELYLIGNTILKELPQYSFIDGAGRIRKRVAVAMNKLKKIRKSRKDNENNSCVSKCKLVPSPEKKSNFEFKQINNESYNTVHDIKEISELPYLHEVWNLVKTEPHMVSIFPRFQCKLHGYKIQVDVVSYGGKKWIKIKNKEASDIQFNFLKQSSGHIGITIKKLLLASEENKVNEHSPKIFFYFTKGVTEDVATLIENSGANFSLGKHAKIFSDNNNSEDDYSETTESSTTSSTRLKKSQLEHQKLNYDNSRKNLGVHTLVALVSNLTNGLTKNVNHPAIQKCIEQEKKNPVKQQILNYLKNKKLICCESAVFAFKNIVSKKGGPTEQKRAKELLKTIEIVPDLITKRVAGMKKGGKVPKAVFGTGDALDVTTVSIFSKIITSARCCDIHLNVWTHESRPLTELFESKNNSISIVVLDTPKNKLLINSTPERK